MFLKLIGTKSYMSPTKNFTFYLLFILAFLRAAISSETNRDFNLTEIAENNYVHIGKHVSIEDKGNSEVPHQRGNEKINQTDKQINYCSPISPMFVYCFIYSHYFIFSFVFSTVVWALSIFFFIRTRSISCCNKWWRIKR